MSLHPRPVLATAAVAILALGVSGCGGGGAETPAAEPTTSSTPSPSARPTATPETRAVADATTALRRYFTVLYGVALQPKGALARLQKVVVGQQLQTDADNYTGWQARGWHATARPSTTVVTVASTSLDNSDPAHGKAPTVRIEVCTDVSKVDVVDGSGKSIVAQGRAQRTLTTYVVLNPDYTRDPRRGWRVVDSKGGTQTC